MKPQRSLLSILMLLLATFLLVGCTPLKTSESAIISDVQSNLLFIYENNLTIKSIEVEERLTDSKAGSDIVYAWLNASNDVAECRLGVSVCYHLYDDGWRLSSVEEFQRDIWEVTPIGGPSDEEIESFIGDQWFRIFERASEYDDAPYTYAFKENVEHPFMTETNIVDVYYNFNENQLRWESGDYEIRNTVEDWKVNGTWSFYNEMEPYVIPFRGILNGQSCVTVSHISFSAQLDISSYDGQTLDGNCNAYYREHWYDTEYADGDDINYETKEAGLWEMTDNEFYIQWDDTTYMWIKFDRNEGLSVYDLIGKRWEDMVRES